MDLTDTIARQAAERDRQMRVAAEAAAHQLQAASSALEGVRAMLQQFEARLNKDEEVAILVIGGPTGEAIFPAAIEASGPDRLIGHGDEPAT
jgi:hypothetical protein